MFFSPKFFPTLLIILDFLAALRYGWAGDIRHALYWSAAGVLTATVTY